MDTYITGATIKTLREKRGITQKQLADVLGVSGKAISKW
jgi:transcriptional regulator with XRE-family HTH domain